MCFQLCTHATLRHASEYTCSKTLMNCLQLVCSRLPAYLATCKQSKRRIRRKVSKAESFKPSYSLQSHHQWRIQLCHPDILAAQGRCTVTINKSTVFGHVSSPRESKINGTIVEGICCAFQDAKHGNTTPGADHHLQGADAHKQAGGEHSYPVFWHLSGHIWHKPGLARDQPTQHGAWFMVCYHEEAFAKEMSRCCLRS